EAPGVASAYPFRDIKKVCDVAGGNGMLLSEILAQHPHLEGILVDQPARLEEARARFRQRNVLSRCELTPGDIFESVPAGADAYLLKDVLHDWDDARSLAILKNCRRAMNPDQRLLVVEMLMVDDPAYPLVNLIDMQMMTVCSEGRQRSEEQFRALFHEAGFDLCKVHPLPGLASIVEGIAK
ncbi:MAG TPA: methyltransferase, partial [Polyangiaceae bacterium]|nr:methyltransferase [Polyangiaceae bacterium]